MTQKQNDEFDLFGCASRCLIMLANASGAGHTKAGFIDKFAPKYWPVGDKCGIHSKGSLKAQALEMGLAAKIDETKDFDAVRKHIRDKSARNLTAHRETL